MGTYVLHEHTFSCQAGKRWGPLLRLRREAMEARGDVIHEPVPPAGCIAPTVFSAVADPIEGVAGCLAQAPSHRRDVSQRVVSTEKGQFPSSGEYPFSALRLPSGRAGDPRPPDDLLYGSGGNRPLFLPTGSHRRNVPPPTTPAPICDREAIVKSSAKALSYVEYRTVDAAGTLFPLKGYSRSSEIHSRDVRTGANPTAADCEYGGARPDGHGLLQRLPDVRPDELLGACVRGSSRGWSVPCSPPSALPPPIGERMPSLTG
jgi:hypothetical protein